MQSAKEPRSPRGLELFWKRRHYKIPADDICKEMGGFFGTGGAYRARALLSAIESGDIVDEEAIENLHAVIDKLIVERAAYRIPKE